MDPPHDTVKMDATNELKQENDTPKELPVSGQVEVPKAVAHAESDEEEFDELDGTPSFKPSYQELHLTDPSQTCSTSSRFKIPNLRPRSRHSKAPMRALRSPTVASRATTISPPNSSME